MTVELELVSQEEGPRPGGSRFAAARRRFLANRMAVAALVTLTVLILIGLVAPQLWPYGYGEITDDLNHPPSPAHPMGTDAIGRDLLAQVLRGLQQSLLIAFTVTAVSTVIGLTIGVVSGYFGRWVDTTLMRLVDLVLTLPTLAVAAFLGANVRAGGVSWLTLSLVLGALMWTPLARLVRGVVLGLRELPFIDAARVMGASHGRTLLRHLVPNVTDHVIIAATLTFGAAILTETSLSFLGFGVQPPDTSLGLLVSTAQSALITRPWLFYFPGLLILLLVLIVNYLGDGLRDAFNPRNETSNPLIDPPGLRRRRKAQLRSQAGRAGARVSTTADDDADGSSATLATPGTAPAGTAAPDAGNGAASDAVATVRDLTISFSGRPAVRGVDLDLRRGEVLALVGESGSGKTLTSMSLVGLLPPGASTTGAINVLGHDVDGWTFEDWRTLRGRRIAAVLQDPSTSLNPVLTIGAQCADTLAEAGVTGPKARQRTIELLEAVAIREPERLLDQYPHQLSGGMRQRVVIALAMANDPDIIIADEPTTALDVTVQAQVMHTLRQARERTNAAMLFITHDLALVAGIADRVAVMQQGRVVEVADVQTIFTNPRDEYTRRLLELAPRLVAEEQEAQ